ncbi:MAG: hypothetical protein HKP61_08530 [Dactylosporangium sp.]|nr:hypothetical protein [Dactylosporangium sp.]NNJ60980.1 hypothetical protein [Dactylosporangium sp.]
MRLASFPTLFLAAVLASPALWHAFIVRDLDPRTALLRYLIAVPLSGLMLALLRSMTRGYRQQQSRKPLRVEAVTGEPMPRQRATDDAE